MANLPDPRKPGSFLWTQERLIRRLNANVVHDDGLVNFWMNGRNLCIASFEVDSDGRTLVIELEEDIGFDRMQRILAQAAKTSAKGKTP